MMKRTAIAAAWLAGATIPLFTAAVLLFGCCALPFHKVVHKAMPLCHVAIDMLRGEHREPAPVPTAPEKPVKRLATSLPRAAAGAATVAVSRVTPTPVTNYRSFISLGAMRCDSDVGLHLLVATLLI